MAHFSTVTDSPFGDLLSLEVPQLIHLPCGEGFPRPFGQFPSDRDSCPSVAVAVFGHEPVIEYGQLRVYSPGDAAGHSLLMARRNWFIVPEDQVRRGDADMVRCFLGTVEPGGGVTEVGSDAGPGCRAHTRQGKGSAGRRRRDAPTHCRACDVKRSTLARRAMG
jgi:hypothetical protein